MLKMLISAKRRLWDWPDGLVWRLAARVIGNSREAKYRAFMAELRPDKWTTVLDIGVTDHDIRFSNYLERLYPHNDRVIALSIDDLSGFRNAFPEVQCVRGDARCLPFRERTLDIVFSNAVIEHLGSDEDQRAFVDEALRVGRSIFLATPHRHFPLDAHTMLPLLHWLPTRLRDTLYRRLGRGLVTGENLRLLTHRGFRRLFAGASDVDIKTQRMFGLPAQLIAVSPPPRRLAIEE